MLSAGVDLVCEEGLGRGVEHVTFKRVFARLEADTGVRVTHGSVIGRLWANQADYQRDLVVSLIDRASEEHDRRNMATFRAVALHTDRSTAEGRLAAVRRVCRIGGAQDLASLAATPAWRGLIGLEVLLANEEPEERAPTIVTTIRKAHEEVIRRNADMLADGMSYFGLRLRPPLTAVQFAYAVDALVEGFLVGTGAPDFSQPILLPDAGDESEEWSLYGIALHALVLQFFELDPDWRDPAPATADRGVARSS
jgi:hypothetical protein